MNSFIVPKFAIEALIEESELSPKPGLVDSLDNGSHADMDIYLFKKSAYAFSPFFIEYYKAGKIFNGELPNLFKIAREIGVKSESAMFKATNKVNTHKGANFTMAVFISACGYYFKNEDLLKVEINDIENIFDIVSHMAKDLVKEDFANVQHKKQLSYGEKLYIKYGFSGIREEAENGYPTITNIVLPELIALSRQGIGRTEKYLQVLLVLISKTKDSNLVHRGGWEGLEFAQQSATIFLENGGIFSGNYEHELTKMNKKFIEKNLSPGGSADLLSLVILIDKMLNL